MRRGLKHHKGYAMMHIPFFLTIRGKKEDLGA